MSDKDPHVPVYDFVIRALSILLWFQTIASPLPSPLAATFQESQSPAQPSPPRVVESGPVALDEPDEEEEEEEDAEEPCVSAIQLMGGNGKNSPVYF